MNTGFRKVKQSTDSDTDVYNDYESDKKNNFTVMLDELVCKEQLSILLESLPKDPSFTVEWKVQKVLCIQKSSSYNLKAQADPISQYVVLRQTPIKNSKPRLCASEYKWIRYLS